jgi:hypothetical protein
LKQRTLVFAVVAAIASLFAISAPANAKPAHWDDFRTSGVIIWSQASQNSAHNGLGYPGQGFDWVNIWDKGLYNCDNGQSTNSWYEGRDIATGVYGYVPGCNLI